MIMRLPPALSTRLWVFCIPRGALWFIHGSAAQETRVVDAPKVDPTTFPLVLAAALLQRCQSDVTGQRETGSRTRVLLVVTWSAGFAVIASEGYGPHRR